MVVTSVMKVMTLMSAPHSGHTSSNQSRAENQTAINYEIERQLPRRYSSAFRKIHVLVRSIADEWYSPATPNGRCWMHGGKAGRKPIHGRYAKAAIESRRDVRAILRAVRELIEVAGS